MEQGILDYIKGQRIGVLAVEMLDGSPHGATLHFAHSEEPLTFFFLTSPEYRKSEPFLKNGKARASFVVGVNEDDMKTLQLDGEAKLEDTEEIRNLYFGKFPDKLGKHPEDIFISFKPTQWKHTDWTRPEGKTIFTSDGEVKVV